MLANDTETEYETEVENANEEDEEEIGIRETRSEKIRRRRSGHVGQTLSELESEAMSYYAEDNDSAWEFEMGLKRPRVTDGSEIDVGTRTIDTEVNGEVIRPGQIQEPITGVANRAETPPFGAESEPETSNTTQEVRFPSQDIRMFPHLSVEPRQNRSERVQNRRQRVLGKYSKVRPPSCISESPQVGQDLEVRDHPELEIKEREPNRSNEREPNRSKESNEPTDEDAASGPHEIVPYNYSSTIITTGAPERYVFWSF